MAVDWCRLASLNTCLGRGKLKLNVLEACWSVSLVSTPRRHRSVAFLTGIEWVLPLALNLRGWRHHSALCRAKWPEFDHSKSEVLHYYVEGCSSWSWSDSQLWSVNLVPLASKNDEVLSCSLSTFVCAGLNLCIFDVRKLGQLDPKIRSHWGSERERVPWCWRVKQALMMKPSYYMFLLFTISML